MITVVRLRVKNKQKRFMMQTYTSASGTSYKAGTERIPSAWRIVRDRKEIKELEEFPQFEIRKFANLPDLEEFIQEEMEAGARLGAPAVRAQIEGMKKAQGSKPKRDLSVLETKAEKPEPVAPDTTPDADTEDDGDEDSNEDEDPSDDDIEDDSEPESEEVEVARAALADAIDRELAQSYITRLENKLNKLLAE